MKLAINAVTFVDGTIETIKGNAIVQESNDIEIVKGYKEYRRAAQLIIYPIATTIVEGSFVNQRKFNNRLRRHPITVEGDIGYVMEEVDTGYVLQKDDVDVIADDDFKSQGFLVAGLQTIPIVVLPVGSANGISKLSYHIFAQDVSMAWTQMQLNAVSFNEGTGAKLVRIQLHSRGDRTSNGKISFPFLIQSLTLTVGVISAGRYAFAVGATFENREITKTLLS